MIEKRVAAGLILFYGMVTIFSGRQLYAAPDAPTNDASAWFATSVAEPEKQIQPETNPDCLLNPESIMSLTMKYSAGIKAAKHKLESAEFNFKLFESEYTQFSPLKMESEIQRDKDCEYESEMSVGVEKKYFDGSSISAGIGTRNLWGENATEERGQFFKTKVKFPLFSSSEKLGRINKRTFEENELYSAQLDYVDVIRDTIKNALETYYDYIPRSRMLDMLRTYKEALIELKNSGALRGRPEACQLLEGEINSLTSRIQGEEIEVQTLQIEMERWIGIDDFEKYTIDLIGLEFSSEQYYGRFYVVASFEEILKQTIENDTELMVLKLIEINASEKKRLAQKGKWDMFLTVEGRYNFNEEVGGASQGEGYEVGSVLTIQRADRSVLLNTIQKANADIYYIEKKMEDRRREMASEIAQKKVALLTTKDQVLSSRTTLDSWKKIHNQKKDEFLRGTETADNYIQAFRTLVDTAEDTLGYENEYFDTIRDFDYICGTYFRHLGINVGDGARVEKAL